MCNHPVSFRKNDNLWAFDKVICSKGFNTQKPAHRLAGEIYSGLFGSKLPLETCFRFSDVLNSEFNRR
jgi:hypothetical protein